MAEKFSDPKKTTSKKCPIALINLIDMTLDILLATQRTREKIVILLYNLLSFYVEMADSQFFDAHKMSKL